MSKLSEATKKAKKIAATKPRKADSKNVSARARQGLTSAKRKASDSSAAAKKKAGEIYGKGRDAASRGAQNSKALAGKAKQKSGESIEANPLLTVAGGLALGAIVGALLPRSEREEKIMGKTGKKINDGARQAASAAKEAGKKTMAEVGLDAEHAKGQLKDIFGKANEAAKAAGTAAKDSVKKSA